MRAARTLGLLVAVAVALLLRVAPAFAWTDDPLWDEWSYIGSPDASGTGRSLFPDLGPKANADEFYHSHYVAADDLWHHFDWTYPAASGSRSFIVTGTTSGAGLWNPPGYTTWESEGENATLTIYPTAPDYYLLHVVMDAASVRAEDEDTDYWERYSVPVNVFESTRPGESVPPTTSHLQLDAIPYPWSYLQQGVINFGWQKVAGQYEWTYVRGWQAIDGTEPVTLASFVVTGSSGSVPELPTDTFQWEFGGIRLRSSPGGAVLESHPASAALGYGCFAGETDDPTIVGAFLASPDASIGPTVEGVDPTPGVPDEETGQLPDFPTNPAELWATVDNWLKTQAAAIRGWLWPIDVMTEWGG